MTPFILEDLRASVLPSYSAENYMLYFQITELFRKYLASSSCLPDIVSSRYWKSRNGFKNADGSLQCFVPSQRMSFFCFLVLCIKIDSECGVSVTKRLFLFYKRKGKLGG